MSDFEDIARRRVSEAMFDEREVHRESVTVRLSGLTEPWDLIVTNGTRYAGVGRGGRVLVVLPGGPQDDQTRWLDPLAGLAWSVEHGKPFIHHVWVDPEARGQGLGKDLVRVYRKHVSPKVVFAGPFSEGGLALAKAVRAKIVENPGADDEWMAQYDAWEVTRDRMRAEFIEQARARFARDRVVSVESYGDEVRFTSSLTKATRPGVAYQVTDFEGDEPIGHHEYDDLDEALAGLWELASPRTKGLPPVPNPNRNPSERPPFKYRYLGTDDEESVCGCCGRQDLKRVAWLVALDEEGNEIRRPVPYGTTCAGLLLRDVHHVKGTKKPSKGESEKILMQAWQDSVQEAWNRAKPLVPPEPAFSKTSFGTAMIYVGDVGQPRTIRSYRGEGEEPVYQPVDYDLVQLNWDWRKRRATEIGREMGIVGIHPTTFSHVKNPSGRLRRAAARISNP